MTGAAELSLITGDPPYESLADEAEEKDWVVEGAAGAL